MTNYSRTEAKVAVYAAQMSTPKSFDLEAGLGLLLVGLATLIGLYLSTAV